MRATLSVIAATVILIVIAWIIDDVVNGEDIPRGVEVDAVAVGSMSREEAAVRLASHPSLDTPLTLVWDEASVTASAAELGIDIDIEATLDEAAESGGATQPFRWLFSPVANRRVTPHYFLDRGTLVGLLGEGANAVLLVDPDGPGVALVEGGFVSADTAKIPIIDIAELERRLLIAVTADGEDLVELPTLGSEAIDVGGTELARRANELTQDGIEVALLGFSEYHPIPAQALRQWVEFSRDAEISLNNDKVVETLAALFVGLGDPGQETTFFVDYAENIHIVGGSPGSVCCTEDTGERILDALIAGEGRVKVRPTEDPDAKGVAWAESLGIREVVGQFTTNFAPGQPRVINIFRIAELTQGAVIEPGGTFSVNGYIGPRTVEEGFVPAGTIYEGVFVDSIGGGISQYATTLFNAAFFAGLDFGVYQSHSIYLDRYPYGREATVSHPAPDLQIINNTPYGVLIWPTVTQDSITVRLYSTRTVFAEQTDQTSVPHGLVCTNVYTERTRTYVDDGRKEVDTVFARYHPEGTLCDGTPSVSTTTTVPDGENGDGDRPHEDEPDDEPDHESGDDTDRDQTDRSDKDETNHDNADETGSGQAGVEQASSEQASSEQAGSEQAGAS
ncbi:MAG: hypothetical protein F4Z58_12215 [Acidimicrobiaceae bacterium]|nr:hypothetical protein [Acidimicrobiaceae bacterium]MYD06900.1 hypothetical protein [Acidimicrobiaceae bacterium]MYI57561.1 hypothetical protein [Acidimicrobiaceae bacterium]